MILMKRGSAKKASGQTDILIAGGGVAGLALAILLGRAGLRVMLAEPHAPPPMAQAAPSGRTVALMNASLNILRPTQVLELVMPFANPMARMRIIDDSVPGAGSVRATFDAAEAGQPYFGLNIPNAVLRAALFELAQAEGGVHIIGAGVSGLEAGAHEAAVRFTDGSAVRARLVVGADGRNSAVRTLAGIGAQTRPYGQSAITCLIAHTLDHENTSTEFHRPPGPFALVPLPGRRSSVVWVEKTERAGEISGLGRAEFTRELQARTAGVLGDVELETGPECWPLVSLSARALSAPRVALIAEAAHVMSPVTAQGLNLSLRDVAALAELVTDAARLGLDIGGAGLLADFEKRRRLDIRTRIAGVDGMNRAVSTEVPAIKILRRAGLKAVDFCPPIKALAMQTGLAPRIDRGRLARGESL